MVKFAINEDRHNLRWASEGLQKQIVAQNGMYLDFVDFGLKNYLEIVKAAVTQNGMALKYSFFLETQKYSS